MESLIRGILRLAGVAGVLLLTMAPASSRAQGREWFSLDPNAPPGTPVSIDQDTVSSTAVESFFDVLVHGFWYETRESPQGEPFVELTFPGLSPYGHYGAPKLPMLSIPLAVLPEASGITDAEWVYDNVELIPLAHLIWPNPMPEKDHPGDPERFVPPDLAIYGGTIPWPVGHGDTLVAPTRKCGAILSCEPRMFPIHWDPSTNQVSVPRHVRYHFQHPGTLRPSPEITKDTLRQAARRFLNWEELRPWWPRQFRRYTGDYLILTPVTYYSKLTPFVKQKAARGYGVTVQTIPSLGNTCNSIRALIDAWYAGTPSWHDHYCLLIGDTSVIPFCTSPASAGGDPTDDLYGDADADGVDDADEEVFVGRLSPDDASDVANQLDKWLRYMDHPSLFFNYGRELLVAHKQGAPGKYEGAQESVANYTGYTVAPTFTKVYGSNAANNNGTVSTQINNGKGLVCYRGHGDWDMWWHWDQTDQDYDNAQVDALTNTVAPVVWSFACSNYEASQEDCLSEHWLERSVNKGGVSHYGATVPSWTSQNHVLDRQMHKAVFEHGFTKQGRAIEWSEAQMADSTGSGNDWMYGLLGDPDMDIRRRAPLHLVLRRPIWLPINPGGFTFAMQVVDEDGLPIPDAVIGAYKPGANPSKLSDGVWDVAAGSEVFDNAYSDANGEVVLQAATAAPGFVYVAVRFDGGDGEDAILDSIPVTLTSDTSIGELRPLELRAVPSVTLDVTTFHFGRALERAFVVRVYDVAGHVVRTLAADERAAVVPWDCRDDRGRRVPSGVYFAQLTEGQRQLTARVVVVRR